MRVNGKLYDWKAASKTKVGARKKAVSLRKKGYNARVKGSRGYYAVYARKGK